MAAPMEAKYGLQQLCKLFARRQHIRSNYMSHQRQMGLISKLRQLTGKREDPKETEVVKIKDNFIQGETTVTKKRKCIEERRPYSPPADVIDVIQAATEEVYGSVDDWSEIKLTNRYKKFNLLTRIMSDLDHHIPNMDLHSMNTVQDIVKFFNIEVRDTSSFEDLAKLDLPKNLHMNLEPIRFHPETDKIFGGKTAFPGQPTIVSSVKYKRKYKGHDGGDPVNSPWEFKY